MRGVRLSITHRERFKPNSHDLIDLKLVDHLITEYCEIGIETL